MQQFKIEEKWLRLATAVALIPALFLYIGKVPLYLEEPRRALVAMEMIFSGNYVVPTLFGEFYYFKTPLFNWILAGLFLIFDSFDEWIPRTVTVVSLLATAGVHYYFARKYIDESIAWWSALCFVLSADIFFYFSLFGEIDIFYSLITYSGIVVTYHFYRRRKFFLFYFVPYMLCFAGFMTKGFPSPVFLGIATLVVLFMHADIKRVFHYHHIVSFLCFAGAIVLYFMVYSKHNDPWLYLDGLWSQSNDRTFWEMPILIFFKHLVLFPLETAKNMFPATLFVPLLFIRRIRNEIWKNHFTRFCAIVFMAETFIYWISPGTRSRYLYMMYPFAATVLVYGFKFIGSFKWKMYYEKFMQYLIYVVALAIVVIAFLDLSFIDTKTTIVLCVLAAILVLSQLVVSKSNPTKFGHFLLMIVLVRIGFNMAVLPERAQTGRVFHQYNIAMEIHERSKDGQLWLYGFKTDGSFSLATTYYLEKERREILRLNYGKNCTDFFIGENWEFDGESVNGSYTYDWREKTYWLVKFEDCE